MELLPLLQGIAGLITASGSLITGIAALIGASRQRKQRKENQMSEKTWLEKALWILGVSLIAFSGVVFAARAAEPLDAKLQREAWEAFKAKDFPTAISKCEEMFDEFRGVAELEQAALEQKKAPQVAKGSLSEAEKKVAFERGPLNGVGACYFIVGRSAESQKRADAAKEAYQKASKFTYARVWDPSGQGFFWPPAEAALGRLAALNSK